MICGMEINFLEETNEGSHEFVFYDISDKELQFRGHFFQYLKEVILKPGFENLKQVFLNVPFGELEILQTEIEKLNENKPKSNFFSRDEMNYLEFLFNLLHLFLSWDILKHALMDSMDVIFSIEKYKNFCETLKKNKFWNFLEKTKEEKQMSEKFKHLISQIKENSANIYIIIISKPDEMVNALKNEFDEDEIQLLTLKDFKQNTSLNHTVSYVLCITGEELIHLPKKKLEIIIDYENIIQDPKKLNIEYDSLQSFVFQGIPEASGNWIEETQDTNNKDLLTDWDALSPQDFLLDPSILKRLNISFENRKKRKKQRWGEFHISASEFLLGNLNWSCFTWNPKFKNSACYPTFNPCQVSIFGEKISIKGNSFIFDYGLNLIKKVVVDSSVSQIFIHVTSAPFIFKKLSFLLTIEKEVRVCLPDIGLDSSSCIYFKFDEKGEAAKLIKDILKLKKRSKLNFKIEQRTMYCAEEIVEEYFDKIFNYQSLDFTDRFMIEYYKSTYGYEYGFDIERRIDLFFENKSKLEQILRQKKGLQERDSEDEEDFIEEDLKAFLPNPNGNHIYIKKMSLTPSRFIYHHPQLILKNRILQKYLQYANDFVIVQIKDENLKKISHPTHDCTEIFNRIEYCITDGIKLRNGEVLRFLGFSNSQFRSNSFWFFRCSDGINENLIRNSLGNVATLNPVHKYLSRVALGFTSCTQTISVKLKEIEDIQSNDGKYNFTDGCGRIDTASANTIKDKLGFKETPQIFQIRVGGIKGTVRVSDMTEKGTIEYRPSMKKFNSDDTMVGIVSYNKSLPCYLNRQIIVLLSALGISDQIFLDMHKKDREEYAKILTNKNAAITKLKSKHISIFEDLNEYPEDLLLEDPFLKNLLFCTYQKRIGELKFRSRVFVEKGNVLIGTCDDELKKLKYGEVFVSVQGEKEQKQKIIEGKVIVTKNPCLHPGDIRILEAKNYPKYSKYYKNCIVFPTQGKRPIFHEMSGSDLDGDLYFVSWDEKLIPTHDMVESLDYDNLVLNQTPNFSSVKNSSSFAKYVVDFIKDSNLGQICNLHQILCDKSSEGANDEKCIELAKLASIAVDSPKTGQIAKIPENFFQSDAPSFMRMKDKKSYESEKPIGKMYASCKEFPKGYEKNELKEVKVNPEFSYRGRKNWSQLAQIHYKEYCQRMMGIIRANKLKKEAELFTGDLLVNKEEWNYFITHNLTSLVKTKVNEIIEDFKIKFDNLTKSEKEKKELVSAWYYAAYSSSKYGMLGLPWIKAKLLLEIRKENQNK